MLRSIGGIFYVRSSAKTSYKIIASEKTIQYNEGSAHKMHSIYA